MTDTVSTPVVITIPGTPDKCLSPNARRRAHHWGPQARATKQAREAAYWATVEALGRPLVFGYRLTLHAVIAWEKGRRSYDPDAAHHMLKAMVDGLADAIGINDRHITLAPVTQTRDPDGRGFVRIAVEVEPQEAENHANTAVPTTNTSGFKGVFWDRGKWRAQIKTGNKGIYLGRYSDPADAARAYDRAALLHFGEFACLNFPEERDA